ncbi:putative protein kinase RLK-Pelle-LRR-IX family [Helianthus annuus]|nr:putative protein kinase RLK-Pelle-LRR-IX family [Helianthus annuus]
MKLILSGNPLFQSNSSKIPPKHTSPSGSQPDNSNQLSPWITPSTGDLGIGGVPAIQVNVVLSLTPVAAFAGLALLTVPFGLYLYNLKKANSSKPPMLASVGSGSSESPVIKSGSMIISVQVLKNVTKSSQKKASSGWRVRGRYKGQLDDGTKVAFKRLESGVICNKALDEFKSEISVLTKVRHRHLVLLFEYSTQGLKRILVYEYMPQAELSRHLFHWKNIKLEPLS